MRFPFSFDFQSQEAVCCRFLSKGAPEIKVYGAMRFNPEEAPATEWRPFRSFYFIIPQVGITPKHDTFRYLSFYIIFLLLGTLMLYVQFIGGLTNVLVQPQTCSDINVKSEKSTVSQPVHVVSQCIQSYITLS